jgi:hypothetical protein
LNDVKSSSEKDLVKQFNTIIDVFNKKNNTDFSISKDNTMISESVNESAQSDGLIEMLQKLDAKLELFHHNTRSFSQHKGFDQIYEEFDAIKDDLIEKIIGYTGERYRTLQLAISYNDQTGQELVNDFKYTSENISNFAITNNYPDLKNIADSLSGLGAKLNYLLTLTENATLVDEYDVSGCNRQELKRFLAKLDSEGISYNLQGSDEILSFDQTEMSVTLSKEFAKLGAKEINESVYESFVEERLITEAADKDWGRMLDLVIADKNGANVAKSIKDKSKAIARYVAGVKLCGYDEAKILDDYSKSSNQFYEGDYNKFNAFGTKALELGATIDEIIDEFNATEIPQKWQDKHQDMISKNLSNWVTGPLMTKILKAGYDFEQIGKGGNATTEVGQEAMHRSGLKWTIGYKYNLLINGQKYLLAFDAITSEAVNNNTVYFVVDSSVSDKVFSDITPFYKSVNLTKFYNNIINACKNIEQTNESVKFTIQPLQNGITTNITVHDDGVSILQKQGSSNNDVFLSFDQLDELMKQLKHK